VEEEPQDDPELSEEQRLIISKLSTAELAKIDDALLAHVPTRWGKLARVVGQTMMDLGQDRVAGVPDIFYAQRVRLLVDQGLVESVGNLRRMRFSEVRRKPESNAG